MDWLPVELLQQIWLYLPPEDNFVLGCVCSHWHALTESDLFWSAVNQRYVVRGRA